MRALVRTCGIVLVLVACSFASSRAASDDLVVSIAPSSDHSPPIAKIAPESTSRAGRPKSPIDDRASTMTAAAETAGTTPGTFSVDAFQNDLFTAQVRENLAMVDYNKAQVELERVQGTLLEARHVAVPANDSRRTLPYRPRTRVEGAPGGDRQPAGATSSAGLEGAVPSAGGLPNQFVLEGRRLVARWADPAQGGSSAP